MWGRDDLKKTRVYQEAKEEAQNRILSITVPLLLEKGMTIAEIAQRCELSIKTIQQFAPES